MNKRALLFGLFTWLIPFVASFPFFTPDGGLLIDKILFKSIMIVIGSLTACTFLILYFKHVTKDYVREGLTIGGIWFVMNFGLDLLVLVPMSGMSIGEYVTEIGLRYLVIPIMAYTVGRVMTYSAK